MPLRGQASGQFADATIMTFSCRELSRLASLPVLGPLLRRAVAQFACQGLAAPGRDLRQSVPLLPATSQDLERQYVELQHKLERLAALAGQLVSGARRLVAMACGKETGDASFDRTLAVLENPMDYLKLIVEEMPKLAAELQDSARQAVRLRGMEQALERILAPLGITQLMFKVESASLPAEAREVFDALAAQIGALHGRVQVSFRQHSEVLFRTQGSLNEAVASLERHRAERGAQLEMSGAEISKTLARLAEELNENSRRNVQLTTASDALAADVNRAVSAMQTQDIVTQKLEHASIGLGEAIDALGTPARIASPELLPKVATLARIEMAQLDAVETELLDSQCVLQEAISTITSRLGDMDDHCLMLAEFQHITASVDGAAQVLIDSLEGLREMVADTLSLTRQLEDTLRPVEATAGILTGTVSVVAVDMHRIALNAQIRAVQTGGQTGLEVLAEHTAELARVTLTINSEAGASLAETSAGLARSLGRLVQLRESGERALAICDSDGAAEEANLHRFRDSALNEVRRVGALLEEARHLGARMLEGLNFNAAIQRIRDVRKRVECVAKTAEAVAPSPAQSNSASEASGVARRYTMASERYVHARVLQGLEPSLSPTPEASPAPAEFGAGVELF